MDADGDGVLTQKDLALMVERWVSIGHATPTQAERLRELLNKVDTHRHTIVFLIFDCITDCGSLIILLSFRYNGPHYTTLMPHPVINKV